MSRDTSGVRRLRGEAPRITACVPLLAAGVLLGGVGNVWAQAKPAAEPVTDRAELDTTRIIGNRELPKVLYIVPWKKPVPGDLAGRPLVSVIDEALMPVDRDVFRREVNYANQVAAHQAEQKQAAAQAASPPAAAR